MFRQFDDDFGWDVISGGLREVVNDDRKWGAVRHRAIERQHIVWLHLAFVVVRSTNHGDVVAQVGGVFGQQQSIAGGFDSSSGDQDLVVSSRFAGGLEDRAPLFVGKKYGLPSRTQHNQARDRGTRVALH